MEIKANLTEKEVVNRMIELACYLAENDCNDMTIEFNGLHMRFAAYTDVEEGD